MHECRRGRCRRHQCCVERRFFFFLFFSRFVLFVKELRGEYKNNHTTRTGEEWAGRQAGRQRPPHHELSSQLQLDGWGRPSPGRACKMRWHVRLSLAAEKERKREKTGIDGAFPYLHLEARWLLLVPLPSFSFFSFWSASSLNKTDRLTCAAQAGLLSLS